MARVQTAEAQSEYAPPLDPPAEKETAPKGPPRSRFLLMFHAERWHVMQGRLVPDLYAWPMQVGLSGVDKAGRFRIALQRQRDRGYMPVPEDIDGQSYLKRTRNKAGLTIHHTRWETLYVGSERVTSDERGFAKWCTLLVTDGHVPPCSLPVLKEMSEGLQDQIDDQMSKVDKYPQYGRIIKRYTADKAVIDAAIDKLEAVPEVPATSEAVEALDLDEPIVSCSVDDCENKPRTGGRCGKHHAIWKAEQEADGG